jgi:glycosyltransferase involved in cell wall biosynthesis
MADPAEPPRAVAVVVPARNERERLGRCLEAIRAAAARVDVPVHVLVVLDRCTDGTEAVLDAHPDVRRVVVRTPVLRATSSTPGVGWARRLGSRTALRQLHQLAPERLWLASTDADSTVPSQWLAHQLSWAGRGADLVLGTVQLDVEHPKWNALYANGIGPDGTHVHVHGANLGIRASVYRSAGGWPAVTAHEDRHLAAAVRGRDGVRVTTTSAHPVRTSARLTARAPHGLASDLRGLAVAEHAIDFPSTATDSWSEHVN